LAVQIGSRGMALRIIGIDHGSKESLVKECGAEAFLDITKYDDKTITEEVKKLTGGKSGKLESSSCSYLRKGVQC
jgi:propanol-preferring alcohol dehydrogenase